ncbi:MAG TPA: zf-HC2 domain-containing protein [Gemmatimonadota bacterium]|nr:zf-HC2 domain-containing protein [Gemmatimonadota bacterium]
MNGSEHLDTQRIHDLIDGRLDAVAEGEAQAHLLRCDACRRLERESAAVVEALSWYGSEPIEPPAGYWDSFWDRWTAAAGPAGRPGSEPRVFPLRPRRRPMSRVLAPALALAAALALLVGVWWSERPPATIVETRTATAPPLREAVAASGWADDYARFERMSIAVGGIDPVSKGIALASLAEEP